MDVEAEGYSEIALGQFNLAQRQIDPGRHIF
jgi:hypothetical protein